MNYCTGDAGHKLKGYFASSANLTDLIDGSYVDAKDHGKNPLKPSLNQSSVSFLAF